MTGDRIERIAVLIATYGRPELLMRLLDSLAVQRTARSLRVVVVDNDPDSSARAAVASHPLDVEYHHEPDPGIVSARNRGLASLQAADDAMMFIDDDEWAPPDWVETLARACEEWGCAVTTGPVEQAFPVGTPDWLQVGDLHSRADRRTGSPVHRVATNNTLVLVSAWIDAGRPEFDQRFRYTGGSDTDFFGRMIDLGADCRWVSAAVVRESVPVERTTTSWVLRRAIRLGNVRARRSRNRITMVLGGLTRLSVGGLATLGDLVLRRHPTVRWLRMFGRGVGMLGSAIGLEYAEYRRTSTGAISPVLDDSKSLPGPM
ncbi:glycosyltransferase family 2 protein [Nocardioides sp. GY 10113]|uniref:glycosyltransferase family 2 protein n=1 Tax=Nocardioides sp. GY 10113 TaxID=2569761 RepID=UPI0010A885B1|nr:glycosyltransferase family 2 protein [Nocardioides sp. GY 10113]TIC88388.1 glycosyltransferase family 2 protein [Nocardioides sp. GY 10113]